MTGSPKPLPRFDERNHGFWEGAKARELRLLRCGDCGHLRYQSYPTCPACGHTEAEWVATSGRGTIWSFGIFHKAYFPGFEQDLPYNVVIVELDEGPRIYSNLLGVGNSEIRIGMAVEAEFEDVDEVTLVKFRPAKGENP